MSQTTISKQIIDQARDNPTFAPALPDMAQEALRWAVRIHYIWQVGGDHEQHADAVCRKNLAHGAEGFQVGTLWTALGVLGLALQEAQSEDRREDTDHAEQD